MERTIIGRWYKAVKDVGMGKFGRVVLKVRDQNIHRNSLFNGLYLLPDNLG
jgi:hypothetical protein